MIEVNKFKIVSRLLSQTLEDLMGTPLLVWENALDHIGTTKAFEQLTRRVKSDHGKKTRRFWAVYRLYILADI
jgi:hypothetical protein